jgi:subtilisin family serine protease
MDGNIFTYNASGKTVKITPIPKSIIVKYKKDSPPGLLKTNPSQRILDLSENKIREDNIKTIAKYSIAIITPPNSFRSSDIEEYITHLEHDESIDYVTKAFTENITGIMLILTDEVIVSFKDTINEEEIGNILNGVQSVIVKKVDFAANQYVIRVQDMKDMKSLLVANKLAEHPAVKFAEPNFLTDVHKQSNCDRQRFFFEQWHLNNTGQNGGLNGEDIHVLEAWSICPGGDPKVVIAVIDDGVDIHHPSLQDNIWKNPAVGEPGQHGWNFYDGTDDPQPSYFSPPYDLSRGNDIHGTACAGIVSSKSNDDSGICGIAYHCTILPIKIFGGNDPAPYSEIAAAIRYAARYSDILSCSWWIGQSGAVQDAISESILKGRNGLGCIVVAASGNYAPEPIPFPANIDEVIAVGSSTNYGTRSYDSQYGIELDVLAPSSGGSLKIFTTDVSIQGRGYNVGEEWQGDLDGLYTRNFTGTSAAAPVVAGVAALVISACPGISSKQMMQVLRESCDKIDSNNANYDEKGFSLTHGYGRINAKRALESAKLFF